MKNIRYLDKRDKAEYIRENALRWKFLRENMNVLPGEKWMDMGYSDETNLLREEMKLWFHKDPLVLDDNLDYKIMQDDGSVDVITHFELLEHLFNPLLNLEEMYRILSPNGRMYLTTPNDYSLTYKVEHLRGRKFNDHFHQFNEYELRQILLLAGFEIVVFKKFKRSIGLPLAKFSNNSFFVLVNKGGYLPLKNLKIRNINKYDLTGI